MTSENKLWVKPQDLHTHSPDCRGSGCVEVALNQGPRRDDGVGSNPDLRAQDRHISSKTSDEDALLTIQHLMELKNDRDHVLGYHSFTVHQAIEQLRALVKERRAPETCGNCDTHEPCGNQYGICSRHGGQRHNSVQTPALRVEGATVALRVQSDPELFVFGSGEATRIVQEALIRRATETSQRPYDQQTADGSEAPCSGCTQKAAALSALVMAVRNLTRDRGHGQNPLWERNILSDADAHRGWVILDSSIKRAVDALPELPNEDIDTDWERLHERARASQKTEASLHPYVMEPDGSLKRAEKIDARETEPPHCATCTCEPLPHQVLRPAADVEAIHDTFKSLPCENCGQAIDEHLQPGLRCPNPRGACIYCEKPFTGQAPKDGMCFKCRHGFSGSESEDV